MEIDSFQPKIQPDIRQNANKQEASMFLQAINLQEIISISLDEKMEPKGNRRIVET